MCPSHRRCPLRSSGSIMAVVLFSALGGCVTTTTTSTQTPHDVFRPGDLPEMKGNGSARPSAASRDLLTSNDSCPARLQTIAGALLLYYHSRNELPPNLGELRNYDSSVELTCPDSHQPYVYVPAGLSKPGGTRRIIVHDAVYNADGTRWCIMLAETPPGKPLETEVVQLAEPLFLAYH